MGDVNLYLPASTFWQIVAINLRLFVTSISNRATNSQFSAAMYNNWCLPISAGLLPCSDKSVLSTSSCPQQCLSRRCWQFAVCWLLYLGKWALFICSYLQQRIIKRLLWICSVLEPCKSKWLLSICSYPQPFNSKWSLPIRSYLQQCIPTWLL